MKSNDRVVAWERVCLFVVLVVIASGCSASAQENKQEKAAPRPKVSLQTVYLSEPIGHAHQIQIRAELGGQGQVTLDGNTCTITQFGDTGVCTKVFFRPIDVKVTQLRLADPSGQGRRLFRLDGELEPKGAEFFLVVPRRRSEAHRLVVNLDEDRRRVVTLEAIVELPSRSLELCKKAKYRAEQAGGKVTLFAEGEHPTAGWKVAIEQLPIRIFPPQFRLVCFPPKEVAATVITPFKTDRSFAANEAVKEVIVHDDVGRHKVPVKQQD